MSAAITRPPRSDSEIFLNLTAPERVPEPPSPWADLPAGSAVTFRHLDGEYSGTVVALAGQQRRLDLEPFTGNLFLVDGQTLELTFGPHRQRCRVASARIEEGRYRVVVEPERNVAIAKLLNLDRIKIDPSIALQVPSSLALRRQVLAFGMHAGKAHVAALNTGEAVASQALERLFQVPIHVEAAEPESLKRALQRVYGSLHGANLAGSLQARARSADLRSLDELPDEGAVNLGNELLLAAVLRQASDIHIDADRDSAQVRFRVDGALEQYRRLPMSAHQPLISRFKVLAGLDIAEKRAPQDGGFKYTYDAAGQAVDLRVATLPAKHGERMTLRLLALQAETLTLEQLGMCQRDLALFERAIAMPHGMVLLTGPTGSGKSTTLYASLRRLIERESLNVITVEDPIEYEIPGVAQVEIDTADKVSFHKALRSLLRHDPDVVMIGEMRDAETAGITIKASLTGHLVFSTLHTNDSLNVVTRLADMGVDRYLIGASLRLAVAQRLVRRLCEHCRRPHLVTASEAASLNRPALAGKTICRPVGCPYCDDRGYHGRIGLFEMLAIDEPLARLIAEGMDEAALRALARERQTATLLDDAVDKLRAGLTSIAEVLGAVAVW